jgi:hypothetical protein
MRLTSVKQIPPKIQACASAHRLGSPRIVYQPRSVSSLHLFFGPLALLLGSLVVAAYVLLYDSIFSWWPTWQGSLVLIVGIAWLCVGAWILLTPIISPHLRVFLCPKGLIYARRTRQVIRWDEIAVLSKEIEIDKKADVLCSYIIRRNDGMTFELRHDLPYLERLGSFMERESARHLLPRAIVAYAAGTTQEFADILVTSKGLALKSTRRLLHWHELEKLVVDETSVNIYRKGNNWAWATLSLSGIPNIGVLKGLVGHIKGEARTRSLKEMYLTRSAQMDAYDAGISVPFGKLSLSKAGVSINSDDEIVPWDEVASFGVGENEIIIKRSGLLEEWHTLPIWAISNVPVLKELADYALWQQQQ